MVFFAEVPSTDRYHLYLDFKHEGVVRTAAFNVTSSAAGSPAPHAEESDDRAEDSDDSGDHSGDGH